MPVPRLLQPVQRGLGAGRLHGGHPQLLPPTAAYTPRGPGGYNFNNPGRPTPGGAGSGGLILPGQDGGRPDNGGREAPRLVIPNQDDRRGGVQGALGGPGVEGEKRIQNYRPPTGFMDDVEPEDLQAELATASPERMLLRLRQRAGYWHDLARLLPKLYSLGVDNTMVEDASGLERKLQGIWASSLPVYDSLRAHGFPEAKMGYFDLAGSEHLLFELRFLTAQQRAANAEYIVDNQLNAAEAQLLGRMVREHERRKAWKYGFTNSPGDIMAFKHYHDAEECRQEEAKQAAIERGLSVAVSDSARQKLHELMSDTSTTAIYDSKRARVTMLRLLKEEVGYRPVAVAGSLESAHADDIMATPVAQQSGNFGAYRVGASGADSSWLLLPGWTALQSAEQPIALEVRDCRRVPALVEASGGSLAEKEGESGRSRAPEPGLLVLERKTAQVYADQYYVVQGAAGLQLVEGERLNGSERVCGRVIFCARPSARELIPEGDSPGMLSL